MVIADDAVESAPEPRRRSGWAADNPLVRAVGRVRLPLGGKLIVGFCVVGALLAVGYALGIVALGQSNSRGEQVRSLQQTAAFARVVEAEATQLSNLVVGPRFAGAGGTGGSTGRHSAVYAATDEAVLESLTQLNNDIQLSPNVGGLAGYAQSFDPHFVPKLKMTLARFYTTWGTVSTIDTGGGSPSVLNQSLVKANNLALEAINEAYALESKTTKRANAVDSRR